MNANRISFATVQQGYRPRTNPRPLSGLRGLGRQGYRPAARAPRLGQFNLPVGTWSDEIGAAAVPTPNVSSSTTCSTGDVLVYGTSYCNAAEQAQIQQVATNAAAMYGANSPQAIVAQQAANAQMAQVPSDNAGIQSFFDTSTTCDPLSETCSAPPPGTTTPIWVWIALGGLALVALK